jgi:hypothetical protein
MIADLESEFTLMTKWQQRPFDGYINAPIVTEQGIEPGVVISNIHPQAARNKLMSERTDLLLDRPWQLSGDLLKTYQELNDV